MITADYEVTLKLQELFPGENIWNFPVTDESDISDRSIFVNQYGESTADRTLSSRKETQFPKVQIYIRGDANDPSGARDLANDVRKAIQSISWTTSDGSEIEDCKITSGIIPLGADSKNRYQRSINIQLNYYTNLDD